MPARPHTLKPVGVDTPMPSKTLYPPLAIGDLQRLQAALSGVPFTLEHLIAAIICCPKSMASVIKTAGIR